MNGVIIKIVTAGVDGGSGQGDRSRTPRKK